MFLKIRLEHLRDVLNFCPEKCLKVKFHMSNCNCDPLSNCSNMHFWSISRVNLWSRGKLQLCSNFKLFTSLVHIFGPFRKEINLIKVEFANQFHHVILNSFKHFSGPKDFPFVFSNLSKGRTFSFWLDDQDKINSIESD